MDAIKTNHENQITSSVEAQIQAVTDLASQIKFVVQAVTRATLPFQSVPAK
jgi:hypothetical protein